MKITDVGAAYDPQFERVEMSDNLREAAKAALLALKCLDGLECAREEIENLEAALAEPAIKDSLTVAEPVAWMSDKLREAAKTKMTLAELRNMISMSNTITFAKRMQRAEPEEIERELLACINEWLRGDDELTRLKREKNT